MLISNYALLSFLSSKRKMLNHWTYLYLSREKKRNYCNFNSSRRVISFVFFFLQSDTTQILIHFRVSLLALLLQANDIKHHAMMKSSPVEKANLFSKFFHWYVYIYFRWIT